MSKSFEIGLTPFGEITDDQRRHLERDRWPEFEKELKQRRPRTTRFDLHNCTDERQPWEWLIWRCRTWDEVRHVLNHHKVVWEKKGGRIVMEGMNLYRCA